jgi:hypothetical protein
LGKRAYFNTYRNGDDSRMDTAANIFSDTNTDIDAESVIGFPN